MLLRETLATRQRHGRQLEMIKLISFLIPFLIGMRRRNKVPDIKRLLPPLPGEYQIRFLWVFV